MNALKVAGAGIFGGYIVSYWLGDVWFYNIQQRIFQVRIESTNPISALFGAISASPRSLRAISCLFSSLFGFLLIFGSRWIRPF